MQSLKSEVITSRLRASASRHLQVTASWLSSSRTRLMRQYLRATHCPLPDIIANANVSAPFFAVL